MKIDAESKQTEMLPAVKINYLAYDFYNSYDFNTYVSLRQEKDETGMLTGFLTLHSLDSGQEKEMLKITGEDIWFSAVTDNYTVLRCKDGKEAYIAIVPVQK